MVAALSVPELFMQDATAMLEQTEAAVEADDESTGPTPPPKPMQQWKLEGIDKGGDFGMLLCAVGACDYEVSKGAGVDTFCTAQCIRSKAMHEIRKLRLQIERHGKEEPTLQDDDHTSHPSAAAGKAPILAPLPPPTPAQQDAVRQIILSGFGDHVARLSSQVEPELAKHGIFGYACDSIEELVYIHPSSALHKRKPE
jgi:ATP-dependent RNA helicase DHX37/DHR1